MKGYFIVFALCVLGVQALPKPKTTNTQLRGRIGGGAPAIPTEVAHATMVLVFRTGLEPGTAALGGGSIVSARHCLTAAHLVQGPVDQFQIGFFAGTARRLLTSTFAVIHQDYDATTFESDIALIFLQGTNSFPSLNIITISFVTSAPTQATELTTVGFGFTAADSTGASSDPYAAAQTVSDPCEFENFNLTASHFCAMDTATESPTYVCPGDNGSGAFEGDGVARTLVGIVSRVLTGCAEPQLTGYTIVGFFAVWIANLAGLPVPASIENYSQVHNA